MYGLSRRDVRRRLRPSAREERPGPVRRLRRDGRPRERNEPRPATVPRTEDRTPARRLYRLRPPRRVQERVTDGNDGTLEREPRTGPRRRGTLYVPAKGGDPGPNAPRERGELRPLVDGEPSSRRSRPPRRPGRADVHRA